jgi:hypothetical protein
MASDLLLLGKSKSRFPAGMTKKEADGSQKKKQMVLRRSMDGTGGDAGLFDCALCSE